MVALTTYISFKNEAKEAMEFYNSVLGGELTVSTFKEGGMSTDPSEDNLTMHARLKTPAGLDLMAADTPERFSYTKPAGFSISLSGDDEATLKHYWEKLSAGGTVTQPLMKSPWNAEFGMFTDKFGINWMVNIDPKQ